MTTVTAPPTRRRWFQFRLRTLLVIVAGTSLTLAGLREMHYLLTVPSLRRALPWSATEVNEWSWSSGFLPDFTYHLKARISPEEFRSYVADVKLAPCTSPHPYWSSVDWSPTTGCGPWWDCSPSLEGTFLERDRDYWTVAKYERGFLYVKSCRL